MLELNELLSAGRPLYQLVPTPSGPQPVEMRRRLG